jgi:hypothetical protein
MDVVIVTTKTNWALRVLIFIAKNKHILKLLLQSTTSNPNPNLASTPIIADYKTASILTKQPTTDDSRITQHQISDVLALPNHVTSSSMLTIARGYYLVDS